jgi:hypothetical protein
MPCPGDTGRDQRPQRHLAFEPDSRCPMSANSVPLNRGIDAVQMPVELSTASRAETPVTCTGLPDRSCPVLGM